MANIIKESLPQLLSPNAAELGRYGKNPVNYFNGLPGIVVPLTSVHAKGYELPDGTTRSFKACTYPADPELFATVPEGIYEAHFGKHHGQYDVLKCGMSMPKTKQWSLVPQTRLTRTDVLMPLVLTYIWPVAEI